MRLTSFPATSLRLRLCASRKSGTGGVGWVHPKGADSMVVSGLGLESRWLELGGPFLSSFAQMG